MSQQSPRVIQEIMIISKLARLLIFRQCRVNNPGIFQSCAITFMGSSQMRV